MRRVPDYGITLRPTLLPLDWHGKMFLVDWYGGLVCRTSTRMTRNWIAEQLADDIGAIPRDASWPLTYIDWEAAAAALQQDYTSIDIDGTTYWGR